jgi:hypothetical protein
MICVTQQSECESLSTNLVSVDTPTHPRTHTHTHKQTHTDTHNHTLTFARLVAKREGVTHNINKPSPYCLLPDSGVAQLVFDGPQLGEAQLFWMGPSVGGHPVVVEAPPSPSPHATTTMRPPQSTHSMCWGRGPANAQGLLGGWPSSRATTIGKDGAPPR